MGPKRPQAPFFLVAIPSQASPRWQVLGLEWPLPAPSAPILGSLPPVLPPPPALLCVPLCPSCYPEPSTPPLSSLPSRPTFILQNSPWIYFQRNPPLDPLPQGLVKVFFFAPSILYTLQCLVIPHLFSSLGHWAVHPSRTGMGRA